MSRLVAWLYHRRVRKRLARYGRIAALRHTRFADADVLLRAGLHLSVIEVTSEAKDARHLLARARALAALGAWDEALAIARSLGRRLDRRSRTSLALAIGRWNLDGGLSLLPLQARVEKVALLFHGERREEAMALAEGLNDWQAWPDVLLLKANADFLAGRFLPGRARLNRIFEGQGMRPAVEGSVAAPLSLKAFLTAALPLDQGRLVSVVMAVRDLADYIGAAVRSMLQQSWRRLELIVVDDCSLDCTASVVEAAAAGDPRFRLLRLQQSGGAYAARNIGLRAALGAYVTFFDGDDVAHPQHIEQQVMALTAEPQAVAVTSRLVRLDSDGLFVAPRCFPLVRHNPASVMFRRALLDDGFRGFDEAPFGADEELLERLRVRFGPARVLRLRAIHVVAASRADSLTAAPETGLDNRVAVKARTVYRETWSRRLAFEEHASEGGRQAGLLTPRRRR